MRFRAEVSYDSVQSTGQKIEFGGSVEVSVRRPDRLRVDYEGDERRSRIFFDGEKLTLHDVEANLYATSELMTGIDAAMDRAFEDLGFSVPIADLVYSDPYESLMGSVEGGKVVGKRSIDGTLCIHLAFTQETIDWQIWIADGPEPQPRKLVITYKNENGAPRYAARLFDWDVDAQASDSYFQFRAPLGANQISFVPASGEVQP